MLVRELKELLREIPDDLEVIVRCEDDDGGGYIGTIGTVKPEQGCSGPVFCAIDCGPEEAQEFEVNNEDDEEDEDDEDEDEQEEQPA